MNCPSLTKVKGLSADAKASPELNGNGGASCERSVQIVLGPQRGRPIVSHKRPAAEHFNEMNNSMSF